VVTGQNRTSRPARNYRHSIHEDRKAYSIVSDASKKYEVTVKVKAVDAPAEAQLISGGQVRPVMITQKTWQEIKLDPITLIKGNNQLKWQVTTDVVDLDWMELRPSK